MGLRLAPSADNTIMEIRGPCRIILQFSASFCTPRRTARRSGSTVAGWLRRCQQNNVRRQTPGHWTTGCQTKKGIIKPKIIKQQNWTGSLRTGFHWAVALAHAEALALADPTTGQNNSAIIRQDNEKLISDGGLLLRYCEPERLAFKPRQRVSAWHQNFF